MKSKVKDIVITLVFIFIIIVAFAATATASFLVGKDKGKKYEVEVITRYEHITEIEHITEVETIEERVQHYEWYTRIEVETEIERITEVEHITEVEVVTEVEHLTEIEYVTEVETVPAIDVAPADEFLELYDELNEWNNYPNFGITATHVVSKHGNEYIAFAYSWTKADGKTSRKYCFIDLKDGYVCDNSYNPKQNQIILNVGNPKLITWEWTSADIYYRYEETGSWLAYNTVVNRSSIYETTATDIWTLALYLMNK